MQRSKLREFYVHIFDKSKNINSIKDDVISFNNMRAIETSYNILSIIVCMHGYK